MSSPPPSLNNEPPAAPKIGFSFKKVVKAPPVITTKKWNDDVPKSDEPVKEFVTAIDNDAIHGDGAIEKSKQKIEYVIPLIQINKYHINKATDATVKKEEAGEHQNAEIKQEIVDEPDESKASAESVEVKVEQEENIIERAKRELIEEGRGEKKKDDESDAWKSMIINKPPSEYENDNKLDVSIRPLEPSLDDYATIPVEAFGAALLRGMGWKEGAPIGGINKAVVNVFEPKIRAKGLGLGADSTLRKQLQDAEKGKSGKFKNDGPLLLRKGCHVCIEIGAMKGQYGVVESISDDLSHASVKLTLLKSTVDLPHALLRIVTKKEYDEESKIINKKKYEEFKVSDNNGKSQQPKQQSTKDRKVWLVPGLKVKILDKNLKKYYKEKAIITKVSGDRCRIQTTDGKTFEDVSQSRLQTVIPSRGNARIMILKGEYQGEMAHLDETTRCGKNEAAVKLAGTVGKSKIYSLDDICEYVKNL